MLTNFSRHTLTPQSTEYIFVADKFQLSWANLRNQPLVPAPPPPPPIPVGRPPPPPPGFVPTTNGPQPPIVPATFLQRIVAVPASINNNNNGSMNYQLPPPLPNHNFVPLSYPLSLGANAIVQPASLPPPLPPPSVTIPYPPQHPYRSAGPYTRTRGVHALPMNNTAGPTRPSRTGHHITNLPRIIQIERIQNQRWYKQYSAHECEFRQKLGKQTEQWLFHGKYQFNQSRTFSFVSFF